ncbi:hypothetical protein BpHYR1_044559 [Brachionus plicatilis]|uniref:Uncharacterized protein n=1 Tax=Brachionus plicatilis TaxID=10195 RepID=A0A3M7R167_BRAPC|nr:hypothetical protein BpHYR1_044559 [Brachionus plicatilis]
MNTAIVDDVAAVVFGCVARDWRTALVAQLRVRYWAGEVFVTLEQMGGRSWHFVHFNVNVIVVFILVDHCLSITI